MPITHIWEENGLYTIMEGHITALELVKSNSEFLEHPNAIYCHYQLVNALGAEYIELDEIALVDLAADDAAFSRKIKDVKVAMITDNSEFRKLAEKYIQLSWKLNSSWHFRIFETEDEARDWLQLDLHTDAV